MLFRSCHGKGRSHERKKISVKVPAGVDTGLKLRVSNEGEGGYNEGPSGDLYVVLHVKEAKNFNRDGVDIILKHPVSFVQAALGCKVAVETLEEDEAIEIPAGSQHGQRITIPGAGVPHLRGGGRGDLFVELHIIIPKKLSKEQREILEKYAEIAEEEVYKGGGQNFFQRMFDT